MDGKILLEVQLLSNWIGPDTFGPRKPTSGIRFSGWATKKEQRSLRVSVSARFEPLGRKEQRRLSSLEVSCSYQNSQASILESGSVHAPFDEGLALQSKSQEIEPHLNGRCIYLVGLMGSGKTTVGKILAQAVGYTFFDCDTLIEQSVDGTSVAEIFKMYGEDFFREKETEALRKLSIMHRLVVSTGGGAVVRPINWRYMQKGISVWLDVPLEALAKRIAAVGTASRPLLHHESGDAYMKTLKRLSTLFDERYDAYASANARVSLENIAVKLGHEDVSRISPTEIALEAIEQIGKFLDVYGGTIPKEL